jgi:hypothetical protein
MRLSPTPWRRSRQQAADLFFQHLRTSEDLPHANSGYDILFQVRSESGIKHVSPDTQWLMDDTTERAIRRNSEQPRAKKSAYLSRFCNLPQHSETGDSGLWLRRARVRVPSVTLSFAGKTQLSMALAESCGSGRAAVELNCDMLAAVVDKSTSRTLIFTTLFEKRSGI